MATRESLLGRFVNITTPLTKGQLFEGKSTAKDQALLDDLLQEGGIVNLAAPQSPCAFVTKAQAASDFAPLKVAKNAFLKYLEGGMRPFSITKSNIETFKVPGYARGELLRAIDSLAKDGGVIAIQFSGKKLVISSKAILRRFQETGFLSNEIPSAQVAVEHNQREALVRAYHSLLRADIGMSMVSIGALVERLGWSKEDVHHVLRQLQKTDQAIFPPGEITVLAPAETAAGLDVDGETRYYVRLA
jgi:hypothetical protein